MLVRFAKKRTTVWEGDRSVAEIQRAEFVLRDGEPDLKPSVYEVVAHEVIRAYAEHTAAIPLELSNSLGIDCSKHEFPEEPSEGQPCFEFIKTRHREILVGDVSGLHRLVAILKGSIAAINSHPVTKEEVREYARARVVANDPEWAAVLARPTTKKWMRELAPVLPPAAL